MADNLPAEILAEIQRVREEWQKLPGGINDLVPLESQRIERTARFCRLSTATPEDLKQALDYNTRASRDGLAIYKANPSPKLASEIAKHMLYANQTHRQLRLTLLEADKPPFPVESETKA